MPQDILNRSNELTIGSSMPTAIAPVAPVLPPPTPTSPVSMLSSQIGQNIAQQNEQKIAQLEQYVVKPGDTLSQIAQQKGTNVSDISGYKSGDPNLIYPGEVLTFKGGSPATAQMSGQINQAVKQGILPPTSPALQSLQQQEGEVLNAMTKAKQAIDTGDVVGVDAYRKLAEDAKTKYETGLADLFKELPAARAKRAQLSIPGEREKVIGQQLNTLRSAADQFNLQLQQDKLAQFKGTTLGIATGRASELDFKASFARQEMALAEKNLLSELGLLQEARGMELKNVEQQLDDFSTDFGLRQKVDEQISKLEENVLDKVATLQKDDQKLLFDIAKQFESKAVNWDDLGPEAQAGITDLAQTLNKPYLVDVVKGILVVGKARTLFEDSEKRKKEERLAGTDAESQLYSGLTAPTSTAVRGKVSQFKSEGVVTNFSTIQEGANFASSISDKTKNPADDQALIYSLAKVLDPGSVVREGEYATAQKYSQSWINAYGKGIEQALAGTGFLSETARKNIKNTIQQKYAASEKSYRNLYQRYTQGINNLTGRKDGEQFLVDYSIPDNTEIPQIDESVLKKEYEDFIKSQNNTQSSNKLQLTEIGQGLSNMANSFFSLFQ